MNIGTSIRKLTHLLIILFLALSVGLVYWQVVVAAQVTDNIHNGRSCLQENAPQRGRIFDRNGVLLAESVSDPNAPCGYIRHYIDPSLAGVIGYYVPGYPLTGVEKQFDDYLSGRVGMNALTNTVNHVLHRPPIGSDIYLTIDERIQQLANQHFDDPSFVDNNETFFSDRGSVVVSNPHTGEVLAMISRPGFDPNKIVQTLTHHDLTYYNQLNSDPKQPLLERPLYGKYAPGSTFKTMTLMTALDAGKTTLDQPWSQQQAIGPVYYNGHPLGPSGNNIDYYTFHYPVNTAYGFSHSDNVIFGQIGVNTGYATWMDYAKRFFVGRQIPFDLPVSVSTVLPADGHQMDDNELANNAFGQGFDFVTPFQMSIIDNIVANDGQLMKPMLVAKITDHDNAAVQTFTAQPLEGPQISQQTATQVRHAMFGVTACGGGSLAHVMINLSPWGIISKTGTAQVSSGNIPAHGWLITQAPYSLDNPGQLPALSIIAMKENGGEGGPTVGPLIANLYNDIFSKGYVPAQHGTLPSLNYCYQTGLLQAR